VITSDSITFTHYRPSSIAGYPTSYRFEFNGQTLKEVGADELTNTVTGLRPDTDYWLVVRAVYRGTAGDIGTPFHFRTLKGAPAETSKAYALAGTASIAKLGAKLQLTGTADTKLTPATGAHTTALALAPTKVSGKLAGILPVTADVALTAAPATGTLTGSTLTAGTKVTAALSRITLAGFPIATAPTCATTADLALTAQQFTVAGGGTLTGTFTLPPLDGCGAATPLISAFVAGPGNSVSVTLTPRG
jgi:hypothetical protein